MPLPEYLRWQAWAASTPSLYLYFEGDFLKCAVSCLPQGTFEHLVRKFPVVRNTLILNLIKYFNSNK